MTPVFNSSPGAPNTVWLNCDGGSGVWNGRPWTAPPYTGDVQKLWQTVASWLAAFKVNVTTSKPLSGKFLEVVIGNDFGGYPGGGEADVGSYLSQANPTVFAFWEYFADAGDLGLECLHEIGHAFGLDHQGLFVNGICINPYTPGAIMGNPFEGTLMGWIRGETPTGVAQDDLAVLGSVLGWAGDVNGDGRITIADVQVIASNYGQSGVGRGGGDVNGDGVVDQQDAIITARNLGKTPA